MDKSLACKFAIFQGIDCNRIEEKDFPEHVISDSELDNVLREIFSVDPLTGFPKGDIAYYLSEDGNPVVKDWLVNNLLKPRSIGNPLKEGVTDDMIVEMSRKADESVDDYSSRLMGIFDDAKKVYEESISQLNALKNE